MSCNGLLDLPLVPWVVGGRQQCLVLMLGSLALFYTFGQVRDIKVVKLDVNFRFTRKLTSKRGSGSLKLSASGVPIIVNLTNESLTPRLPNLEASISLVILLDPLSNPTSFCRSKGTLVNSRILVRKSNTLRHQLVCFATLFNPQVI